jgi:hypothetical protein
LKSYTRIDVVIVISKIVIRLRRISTKKMMEGENPPGRETIHKE